MLSHITEEINKKEDKFLKCQVGKVYALLYSNIENNFKKREFVGLCIRKYKKGGEVRITLRNIVGDIGVEMTVGGRSGSVLNVLETKMFKNIYKRAKLYFLRKKPNKASKVKYSG